MAQEQSFPILGFKGLDLRPRKPVPEEGYTRSLQNVIVSNGQITGRGGVGFDTIFSAAMSENIVGLMPWVASNLTTTLLRIGTTKIEASVDMAAWSDVTGTAITGSATDRPQHVIHRDTLYFTNEGQDRPRKYTGSGNTSEISNSTAPWAKAMMGYFGFLFLLNISDDNSTWFPRRAVYSETPDDSGAWDTCAGNELNFNETRGAILTAVEFGRTAVIIKEDGCIYLRWVGGPVRFSQELIKGGRGTLAPLSAQSLGEKGAVLLGDDYELYLVTNTEFVPLPPRVNDILQNDLYKPLVGNCRSAVVAGQETYYLFYPLDSAGNTGRIQFNYRTGEFSNSIYESHAWDAITSLRWTSEDQENLIGAVNTRTYTLDDSTSKTDEITASTEQSLTRYVDSDWQHYKSGSGYCTGATFLFTANSYTKCAISIAIDHKNQFRFRKVYDLKPIRTGDQYVTVRFDLPPLMGEWFNFRIEFLPSLTNNPSLQNGWIHFLPALEINNRRTAPLTEGV